VKLKYIIGILALLLFMVGTASAETFYLTNTSEKIDGENIPGISVNVTFNGTHIIVTDESTTVDGETADIKAIRLYLDNQYIKSVTDPDHSANVWTHTADVKSNFAGFGDFLSLCDKTTDSTKSRGPIVIELTQSFSQLPANALGNRIIVHLGFGDNPEIEVGKYDSSWIGGYNEIPEFKSIATPIAAIIGILFIFNSRKKE
jgi:hypothetical protein